MATVSARNITSTSVTVRVTGVKSGDKLYFFVRLQSDSSDVSGYAYDSASSTSAEADIGGLEPGTNYLANVRINGKWATAVKFKLTQKKLILEAILTPNAPQTRFLPDWLVSTPTTQTTR